MAEVENRKKVKLELSFVFSNHLSITITFWWTLCSQVVIVGDGNSGKTSCFGGLRTFLFIFIASFFQGRQVCFGGWRTWTRSSCLTSRQLFSSTAPSSSTICSSSLWTRLARRILNISGPSATMAPTFLSFYARQTVSILFKMWGECNFKTNTLKAPCNWNWMMIHSFKLFCLSIKRIVLMKLDTVTVARKCLISRHDALQFLSS